MKCGVLLGVATVLCAMSPTESGVMMCPLLHYYNSTVKECVECSPCPINQIIRKPCYGERDTLCGPFKEFHHFQQAPMEDGFATLEHPQKHHKHHKKHHKKEPQSIDKTVEMSSFDVTTPDNSQESALDLTSVSSGEEQWKTLSMALIGVLCVVSICLVIFVFAACYVKHRRQSLEKEIFLDPEMMGSQDTYVQVQPYIPSRDRLKSKSSIRALRELQQNEYDSGSDDNIGNTAAPSSCLLVQSSGVARPMLSEDYDADNSGQTISTTKSSDYVYFNSPQNANGEA